MTVEVTSNRQYRVSYLSEELALPSSESQNYSTILVIRPEVTFSSKLPETLRISQITPGTNNAYKKLNKELPDGLYTYWLEDLTEKQYAKNTVTFGSRKEIDIKSHQEEGRRWKITMSFPRSLEEGQCLLEYNDSIRIPLPATTNNKIIFYIQPGNCRIRPVWNPDCKNMDAIMILPKSYLKFHLA